MIEGLGPNGTSVSVSCAVFWDYAASIQRILGSENSAVVLEQTDSEVQMFKSGWVAVGVLSGVTAVIIVAMVALTVIVNSGGDPAAAGLSSTGAPPSVEEVVPETSTTAVATGGSSGGDVANGETVYSSTCAVCHARDAVGIPGLGKPLVGSDFVDTISDASLVSFISQGRSSDDPENTTGIPMPAKGGNPALTDTDLADVVAYLRFLNE